MNAPNVPVRTPGECVPDDEKFDWRANAGFLFIHFVGIVGPIVLACFIGWSWKAVAVAIILYVVRMFVVTGFRHRYFSHRTYETSRVFQFIMAFIATCDGQRGVLWWAAHHRDHHSFSDTPNDVHSAFLKGFWWSHIGWMTCRKYMAIQWKRVPDFIKYPELTWLEGRPQVYLGFFLLALSCLIFGWCIGGVKEGLWMLVMGFFTSTVFLYHGTFCINSLAHKIGTQRYETGDQSRNSPFLALVTLGEGWHNNHHYRPWEERQGDMWWEIDITHYLLCILAFFRIIRFRPAVKPQC